MMVLAELVAATTRPLELNRALAAARCRREQLHKRGGAGAKPRHRSGCRPGEDAFCAEDRGGSFSFGYLR
jgi:hypothetical protein